MNIFVRKAASTDINDIYKILKPYADDGIILERSKKDIDDALNYFFVAEDNNKVIGTVSYHDYGNNLKEVRSLAVEDNSSRKGAGSALLKALIESLHKDFPEVKIFVLSYYPEFFKKLNFIEIPKDNLPEKIWKDCQNCQNRDNCGETALILSKH
ncbi:MAG: GNAT family N-acetyltransferase [archaeon]|nr:GNAT family N-acetyltransferase [archaeon]